MNESYLCSDAFDIGHVSNSWD